MNGRPVVVGLAACGLAALVVQLVLGLSNAGDFGRAPGDDTNSAAPVLFLWLLASTVVAGVAVFAAVAGRRSLLRSTGVVAFLLALVLVSVGHGTWPMFLGAAAVVAAAAAGWWHRGGSLGLGR